MPNETELLRLATDITSAHVSHNATNAEELPDLFRSIYQALNTAGAEILEADKLQPAVPVKRSVFPGYIICLEDGKRLKMLKRYLHIRYDLTPEAYRTRWGLPQNYPMTALDYAAMRSDLAKEHGLGRPSPRAPLISGVRSIPAGARGRKSRVTD